MYYALGFAVGFLLGIGGFALISHLINKKKANKTSISVEKNDIILKKGEEIKCDKKGLKAGVYTLVATEDGLTSVNLKVAGLVKEYKIGSSLVVSEGDTIKSVSHSIILRK